jgi:HlyD family secretion protein
MRRIRIQAGVIACLLAAGAMGVAGCGKKPAADESAKKGGIGGENGAIPVEAATVQYGTISQTVAVTGSLASLQDVTLSAKANGRVEAVYAREGDFVRKGQLMVRQDTTDLEANVRQQVANVQSAQSKVSQAQTNYTIQVTQAKQNVLQARAQLAAQQQTYLKTLRGSRPQEVLQSQSSVTLAKANMNNALTTLNRNKSLFSQGAIARADLDTAQTTYEVNKAQYENAVASLKLVQEGSRQEDIAAALQQVRQQQNNVNNAIANQQLVSVKRDDIIAAQAGVAQAKATLTFNQVQLQNASIYAPIDGIVASRSTEPGQIAAPGTGLMRIVNVKTVYYQPTISETDFSDTHVGTPVNVTVDAYPGKTFSGKVSAVYPAASAGQRGFSLRVNVPNPDNTLRPGMFARGQVITHVSHNVPIIPTTALVPDAGAAVAASSDASVTTSSLTPSQHVVVLGPGSTAVIRKVTVGIITPDRAEITDGVKAGEKIITMGQQNLKAGDKLAVLDKAGENGEKVSAR